MVGADDFLKEKCVAVNIHFLPGEDLDAFLTEFWFSVKITDGEP